MRNTMVAGAIASGALTFSLILSGCGAQPAQPAQTNATTEAAATETKTETTQTTKTTDAATTDTTAQKTDASAATNAQQTTEQTPANAAPANQTPANAAPAQNNSYIGEEAAKTTALNDAGVSAADCTELKAELDLDDGVPHYDVDFKAGGVEHDYDIDATSGAIISHTSEVDVDD